MPPRIFLVLMLCGWPLLARATPFEVESRLPILESVSVTEIREPAHGRGLELTFNPLPRDLRLSRFTLEEARVFMATLAAQTPVPRARSAHLLGCSACEWTASTSCVGEPGASSPQECMRAGYERLFGTQAGSSSFEDSRWFQALKLSPRYMDEGVREAAWALLGSPTVAYSMGLSMLLYMMAWAAPEPVFSKALAATITVGLLMTYSAVELHTVGLACLNLYREAETARTQEQLDSVAGVLDGPLVEWDCVCW